MLTDQITPHELTYLNKWLRASLNNHKLFDEIKSVWEISSRYNPKNPCDAEKALNSQLEKIKKSK